MRRISLIQVKAAAGGLEQPFCFRKTARTMKPIPDKAEVALEYPDKLYIGSFERSSD